MTAPNVPYTLERVFLENAEKPRSCLAVDLNEDRQMRKYATRSWCLGVTVSWSIYAILSAVYHRRQFVAAGVGVAGGILCGKCNYIYCKRQWQRHQFALAQLKSQRVEGVHYLKMDSLAPILPSDALMEQDEKATRQLLTSLSSPEQSYNLERFG